MVEGKKWFYMVVASSSLDLRQVHLFPIAGLLEATVPILEAEACNPVVETVRKIVFTFRV